MSRKPASGRRGSGGGLAAAVIVVVVIATGHPGHATAAPASGNERLANQMAASAGWDATEQQCLDALWIRESGFSAAAVNPSSGATGIPQLNPHDYAIPAGWSDPSVQVRWGLAYIRQRYGDPCAAWGHEQADGWY